MPPLADLILYIFICCIRHLVFSRHTFANVSYPSISLNSRQVIEGLTAWLVFFYLDPITGRNGRRSDRVVPGHPARG